MQCLYIYLFILYLGGLLLSVQDSAAAEEVEQVTQPDAVPNDTTVNLLSSGLFKKRNKKKKQKTTPKKESKNVGLKIQISNALSLSYTSWQNI